jgi:hypothetical protein
MKVTAAAPNAVSMGFNLASGSHAESHSSHPSTDFHPNALALPAVEVPA